MNKRFLNNTNRIDPSFSDESDESKNEEEIFRNFDAEAQLIVQQDTLPKKSADRYMLVYRYNIKNGEWNIKIHFLQMKRKI